MAPSTMVPVEARASKKPGISVEYGGLEIQDAATGAVQAVIHTHDCIEMLGEGGGDNSYGLVVSMFQRKVATSVEVRVAWFYRYQDTVEQGWKVGDAKASGHNGMEARREIFLTFHLDTVPAESIVGKADIFVCPADAAAPEAKAAIQKSFGGGQGYFWCHEVFNFKTMEPLALEAYREKAKGLEKACIDGAIARAEEAVADWGAGAGAKRGAGPPEGAGLDWTAGLRDDSGKRPNFGGGGGAAQGGTSGAALNGEPADSSAGTRFPSAGKEEELWFEAAAEGFDEVLKEAMAGSKGSLKSLKSKIDALSTVPSGHKLSHIGTVAAEIIAQGTQGAEEGAASACREVSETGVIELMSERLKIVSNKSLANGSEERHAEDDEVASILEALCKLPLNLSTYQWLKQNDIGYTIRDIAKDNTVRSVKNSRSLLQSRAHRRGAGRVGAGPGRGTQLPPGGSGGEELQVQLQLQVPAYCRRRPGGAGEVPGRGEGEGGPLTSGAREECSGGRGRSAPPRRRGGGWCARGCCCSPSPSAALGSSASSGSRRGPAGRTGAAG